MAESPIRVLELRSVRGTGGGPEKTILLSAAQHAPEAVAVTVCYIRDARDDRFHIDATARALGVRYVEVVERHSFDWQIWRQLTDLVRRERIQIVHAHDYKTDLLAWLLGRMTAIIPMATVHGWSGNSWRERLYYRADKKLLPRLPLVIAVSAPIRQTLLEHGADPGRVLHIRNGIDHLVFKRVAGLRESTREALGLPQAAAVVGAVGRLEVEKGFDVLLRAVAAMAPPDMPWVVVAGEGSQRPALEELARQLGIADRVRLLGHRADALAVHHAFDVYAQTSHTEGIPNAVLEAMAVGTPVVASDVGGTGELITDHVHGLLVPANDPRATAAALSETIRDVTAAAARAAAARRRIETELSFAHRLSVLESVYAKVLGQRRRDS